MGVLIRVLIDMDAGVGGMGIYGNAAFGSHPSGSVTSTLLWLLFLLSLSVEKRAESYQ
jgi:hypothetical protein